MSIPLRNAYVLLLGRILYPIKAHFAAECKILPEGTIFIAALLMESIIIRRRYWISLPLLGKDN